MAAAQEPTPRAGLYCVHPAPGSKRIDYRSYQQSSPKVLTNVVVVVGISVMAMAVHVQNVQSVCTKVGLVWDLARLVLLIRR